MLQMRKISCPCHNHLNGKEINCIIKYLILYSVAQVTYHSLDKADNAAFVLLHNCHSCFTSHQHFLSAPNSLKAKHENVVLQMAFSHMQEVLQLSMTGTG
jgi:hypothetical protein